ncbi:MAG: SUMF1/EgtB/PvdO family nonheme iron enzyme [Deltaproteobacteria bacterium]|nr:SUMF1/EgtB/PvdO family nonheme iron enzyme [Deltaproteobacteria bacterium]
MSVLNFDNRYRILQELGRGGMGVVYKAEDTVLGRFVAIKRLLMRGRASLVERFMAEARSAAQLRHPNVVTIYDFNKDAEGLYIVSEFIDGTDLHKLLRAKGALPPAVACELLLPVLDAMRTAHDMKIIHRDIKPANILIELVPNPREPRKPRLVPKVADFGLARLESDKELELTGMVMGTQNYASPEQFRDSKHVDHRTDIYSLGAMFFEMLTNQKPQYLREPNIPPAFRKIILKATETDLTKRYQNLMEMVRDIQSVMEIAKRRTAEPAPPPPPRGQQPPEEPMPSDVAALANMILIASGPFPFGPEAVPVDLPAYYIDRYPVANAQFARFKPSHQYPPEEAEHPATRVSFLEAAAYAQSQGKRLPTEEEWEKAAAGPQGLPFPWGRQFELGRCNTIEAGFGGTTPVHAFPEGRSVYGVMDMSGNVWEWTSTWLDERKSARVLKGGAFNGEAKFVTCQARFAYPERGLTPHFGFRCVKSAR